MKNAIILVAALFTFNAYSQTNQLRPAPFMQCHPEGQTTIAYLPLQDFTVDAKISGLIADVTLQQTFVNTFNTPIEVTYVFPGSTKSAVYGLTMTIGDRIINAEIQERQAARETYVKAVNEGYRASLLEQTRPNVFQMYVGNIMPEDTIIVSLQYTEFMESRDGNYEFVIPTTIGERYAGENQSGESGHVLTSYSSTSQSQYPLSIDIDLSAPVPISNVRSSTHKIDFDVKNTNHWNISLNRTERYEANRDFIFQYRLRGEQLESGLLVHEGEKENFFMLQIQPPKEVTFESVPPREYIFVLDVSGSMQGYPMATARNMLRELLEDLKPNDIFNIIPFEYSTTKLFRYSSLATSDNIKAAMRFVHTRSSSGGTNMAAAFRDVYRSISDKPMSRSIILITDGQVEAEKSVFQEIRNNLYKANVFAFGVGNSVNRYLIEGVANAGMGEAYIVTNSAYAKEQASALANFIKRPALTNIQVNFGNNLVYAISPPSLPDVLSDRPLTIYGKYEGKMDQEITITGTSGNGAYEKTVRLPIEASTKNSALTYLWARNKLKDIKDFGVEGRDQQHAITQIGLEYNLLTDYTSFVAVDNEIANISGQLIPIVQPLARPSNPITNYPTTNSNRSRINSTGAVSRAASASEIELYLPSQISVTAPLILVSWKGRDQSLYTLTVEDIYNKTLLKQEISHSYHWLNLKELDSDLGLYLIQITDASGKKSNEIGIKQIDGLGQTYAQLYNLGVKYGEDIYVAAIADLIQNDLMVDAFTLVEIAILLYPESEWLDLKRNEIWMALGL